MKSGKPPWFGEVEAPREPPLGSELEPRRQPAGGSAEAPGEPWPACIGVGGDAFPDAPTPYMFKQELAS